MTTAAPPQYQVLINHEGQYALLPEAVAAPPHWTAAGFRGTESDCIDYVDARWTDLRPLSLRHALGE